MRGPYLDWAASAPPYPELMEAMARDAVEFHANPSSAHLPGRAAADALAKARKLLGQALGVPPDSLYFCSGGSEANSIILLSVLARPSGQSKASVLISATEHPSIYEQAAVLERLGIELIRLKPSASGVIEPDTLAQAIRPDTVQVSIMAVNNESGAVNDLAALSKTAREASKGRPILFHSDAVQAFGKLKLRPRELGVDALSLSAHKLGGPRGIGALYLRKPLPVLARGGGQEGGLRSGTPNVAGALAFARAAGRAAAELESNHARAIALEERLLHGIASIPGSIVLPRGRTPGDGRYSPYIVSLSFPGLAGETMARALNGEGIAVSNGSACSTGKRDGRVWEAMGAERELWLSSVRVSTGRDTRSEDIDRFLAVAASLYARYKL